MSKVGTLIGIIVEYILGDQIGCTVRFGRLFSEVPLDCLGSRAGLVYQGNSQKTVYKTYCTSDFVT